MYERSARRRDLYLRTHNTHKKQTSMPPGGIQPHNPSKRAAADPRLRPRGHWDWQFHCSSTLYFKKIRMWNVGRDSSIIIVIRLRSGHHRNRNSIAGRGKGLYCSLSCPNRFWVPRSLLSNVYRRRFSGSKAAAA
jgi:hypothetical protein